GWRGPAAALRPVRRAGAAPARIAGLAKELHARARDRIAAQGHPAVGTGRRDKVARRTPRVPLTGSARPVTIQRADHERATPLTDDRADHRTDTPAATAAHPGRRLRVAGHRRVGPDG